MSSIMHSQIWFWIVIIPITVVFIIILVDILVIGVKRLTVLYMFHFKKKVLDYKYDQEYTGNSMIAGILHSMFAKKEWFYRDRTENDKYPKYK